MKRQFGSPDKAPNKNWPLIVSSHYFRLARQRDTGTCLWSDSKMKCSAEIYLCVLSFGFKTSQIALLYPDNLGSEMVDISLKNGTSTYWSQSLDITIPSNVHQFLLVLFVFLFVFLLFFFVLFLVLAWFEFGFGFALFYPKNASLWDVFVWERKERKREIKSKKGGEREKEKISSSRLTLGLRRYAYNL